jgi:hypothetical protein
MKIGITAIMKGGVVKVMTPIIAIVCKKKYN